jgi:hypothetical protein
MNPEHEKRRRPADEQEFIERVAAHYTPPPLTAAQRLAFDREVAARLARRHRRPFFSSFPALAVAASVLLMWFTTSHQHTHEPRKGTASTLHHVTNAEVTPTDDENLLTYAYYSSDFDDDANEEESESFLPDEYQTLDSAFMFPGA